MHYKNIHTNQIINWDDMEFGTVKKSLCGICRKNDELVEDIICDICSKSWIFIDEDDSKYWTFVDEDDDEENEKQEDSKKEEDEKN